GANSKWTIAPRSSIGSSPSAGPFAAEAKRSRSDRQSAVAPVRGHSPPKRNDRGAIVHFGGHSNTGSAAMATTGPRFSARAFVYFRSDFGSFGAMNRGKSNLGPRKG